MPSREITVVLATGLDLNKWVAKVVRRQGYFVAVLVRSRGQKWLANFVKRTDSLEMRFNRAYDKQRALCEDPVLIRSWFELVGQTKIKYGILDEDTYNFDEAGFMIGKVKTLLIVTGSERRGRPKSIQPGNREWVTMIGAINAAGWTIPPFLIFPGQYCLSAWYEEETNP
jgi:hypothetical protein